MNTAIHPADLDSAAPYEALERIHTAIGTGRSSRDRRD
jgi:hypothetical protein